MTTKKRRVQVDIEDIQHILEKLAKAQRRSLAGQARHLIDEALQSMGLWSMPVVPTPTQNIAELVASNFDKLVANTCIPESRLAAYRDGAKPETIDLVRMARVLDMDEDDLVELCHRSQPNDSKNDRKKEVQTNGTA
ncbi:hypothetical protein NG798_26985 [Ancylothrix sp. C2]|uniref:hypothetical protein n=1 Tax=Ancylothrix sp. D3o TaxID=2953691 RepID=UPI0021BA7070|nr:hypothetical protein [Ancylothrix sp. D3o]MCT7953449.1 hypothetical protein [Ancylothrix sp. D3o]